VQLEIDQDLYKRLEARATQTDFDSAEEYSEFVLKTVLDELEQGADEDVRDRLSDLGYL
jgi:hypothetical protein